MRESSILEVDVKDHATGDEFHQQIPVSFTWFEKLTAAIRRFIEEQTKRRIDIADLKFTNPNINAELEKYGKFESVVLLQLDRTVKILVVTGKLEKEETPPEFEKFFIKNPTSGWIQQNSDNFFRDLYRLQYIGVPYSLASEFFSKWRGGLLR